MSPMSFASVCEYFAQRTGVLNAGNLSFNFWAAAIPAESLSYAITNLFTWLANNEICVLLTCAPNDANPQQPATAVRTRTTLIGDSTKMQVSQSALSKPNSVLDLETPIG